jgi:hypothetical protein
MFLFPAVLARRYYLRKKRKHIFRDPDFVYKDTKGFVSEQYKLAFGKYPDLENPVTFNEKLQWLKLYWYNPDAKRCADKFDVRQYIKEKLPDSKQYLNEVYGVYNDPEEIDFDSLPNQFVLKSTHASAQTIICRDKNTLNRTAAIAEMKQWLQVDYFAAAGEWVYKDLPRRIICERLITSDDGYPPKDYKIMCFNGVPKFLYVISERSGHHFKMDYFNCEWQPLPVTQTGPRGGRILPPPRYLLDKMMEISKILSKDFPHVRVDFYIENNNLLIGELTFFTTGGYGPLSPAKYDTIFGSYLTLPDKQ